MPETNVVDFLLDCKDPSRTALRIGNRSHTYGELVTAVRAIAAYLAPRCNYQDRVILIAENSFFWAVCYLGILRAGLVCVPLPAKTISKDELTYVLTTTSATAVFAEATVARKHSELMESVHLITDRDVELLLAQSAAASSDVISGTISFTAVRSEDLAALMFTSGSTGQPRGVMVTHRNIIANTESIVAYLGLREDDIMMTVLPFHYCFGTSLLHTHLRVGGQLVIDQRFTYPDVVLDRMAETGCTGFGGVPSHFQILLRNSSIHKRRFPHLRHIQQAGGHLAPAFIKELRTILPDVRIFIMYGQTEATARLSYLPPEYLESRPGSIGRGIPGVTLRVVDEFGQDTRVGQTGEIVAEGANVAKGYWNAPHETAACFCNGRLHTGDIAQVDSDGFIYVVDRSKDFIKCGGKRVACREVEERLLGFEDLLEVAVIPVPDDVLGEAVKAFAVPRWTEGNGFETRLLEFCRQHMAAQLIPRDIVITRSLPKNSAGKVMKAQLKLL
jgi:acyl-CoA synthetase (AMP-forming)/AMP-acid ligase II